MAADSLFSRDKTRELNALERAKEVNSNRTVAIKLRDCIVYVTPEQAANKKYIASLQKKYDKAREMW